MIHINYLGDNLVLLLLLLKKKKSQGSELCLVHETEDKKVFQQVKFQKEGILALLYIIPLHSLVDSRRCNLYAHREGRCML